MRIDEDYRGFRLYCHRVGVSGAYVCEVSDRADGRTVWQTRRHRRRGAMRRAFEEAKERVDYLLDRIIRCGSGAGSGGPAPRAPPGRSGRRSRPVPSARSKIP